MTDIRPERPPEDPPSPIFEIVKPTTETTNYLLAGLASDPESGVTMLSPGVYYVSKLSDPDVRDKA